MTKINKSTSERAPKLDCCQLIAHIIFFLHKDNDNNNKNAKDNAGGMAITIPQLFFFKRTAELIMKSTTVTLLAAFKHP